MQKALLSYTKRIAFIILFTTISYFSFSQDAREGHKLVDTLASPYFWGRGYTKDGMSKAAAFLVQRFTTYGLAPLSGSSFLQSFSYPVNTFPLSMSVNINGKQLIPGKDFITSPESRGMHGRVKLQMEDSTHYTDPTSRIMVVLEDKLTWSVAEKPADYTIVEVDKKKIPGIPVSIEVSIDNEWVQNFKASNVCGLVKGTEKPDSVIVISAHYDHLGGMGIGTYFPGANDNASGTSLLLGLAKYYASHPQPYSIAFLCFAGEEAGLKGSKYFTENPIIPLKNIRFLLNLDLEGTGVEGITVVNATEFPKEFDKLNEINKENKLLAKINARGKAANSDHYYFSEKGVPAFFIYTLGGIKAYHDVFDRPETLPLNEYVDLFKLILAFNKSLMKASS